MLVQECKRRAGWASLIVLLAGMSAGRSRTAEAQTAPPPDAGVCGSCHYDEALAYTFPAGHAAALDCIACHGDRRPNRVGRRHRTIDELRHLSRRTSTGIPPRWPIGKAVGRQKPVSTATIRTAPRTSIWCATWCTGGSASTR